MLFIKKKIRLKELSTEKTTKDLVFQTSINRGNLVLMWFKPENRDEYILIRFTSYETDKLKAFLRNN